MSDERKTSIVAALLAVRSGFVTPEQAVAALKEPGKASTLVEFEGATPMVEISDGDGQFMEVPILDVLRDPGKQKQALRDIGVSEAVQETLFNFGNGNGDSDFRVLHETLTQVAGKTRRVGDSDIRPAAPRAADSESPTQAPKDDKTGVMRLTTGKFFPNFGVANERYDIRREHARGGMGRIMLARDKAIGRDIALKELLPGLAMGGSSIPGSVPQQYTNESGGIVERFLREAKITAQLEHPNIVPVYEIGKHGDGSIYYTMRFVRGQTLNDRLRDIRKDETLNQKEKLAARIRLLDSFIDVCQAIGYAHSKGVIHRDLKPENIMLGEYGETQVLDWGLARVKGQEDKALKELQKGSIALSKSLLQSDSQALTLDGSIVGTPAYMPPEQARGELENVDEQSDVYSLGAVLYQVLTGFPPYEGPMAALIVQQVLSGPPLRVTIREKDIPPELAALVDKAMAREKNDRIKSALELASEVKAFRDGRTLGSYQYSAGEMVRRFMRQNRTAVGLGVLATLLLVAGTIFFMQRLTEQRDEAELAKAGAEREKGVAQTALNVAEEQRLERERVEREAKEAAQALLDSRVDEARRMMETIDGMRIEPAIADLRARLDEYEQRLKGPPEVKLLELEPDEQVSNGVLLSNLLGFVSAKQSLIDLLTGPAGTQLPDAVAEIDLVGEAASLDAIRLETARLATINGDFALALLLISGSSLEPSKMTAEKAHVEDARAGLLALHRTRISEAMADVEAGLTRDFREKGALNLDGYVKRLSSYRERQTVELLKRELDNLLTRDVSSWTRPRYDLAVLALRVLGNVELPADAVPVLAAFLERPRDAELDREAGLALCAAGSNDAFDALVLAMRRRGLEFGRELESEFARMPMPQRVRSPSTLNDWIDRSSLLRARRDFAGAELAADKALLLDEKSAEALLHRALAHAGSDRMASAMADLGRALQYEPEFYEALLERGRLANANPGMTVLADDFDAAIKLRPEDWRGYRARGDMYARRFKPDLAVADYEKALSLDPGRLELYFEFAERLRNNNRAEPADKVLTRAVERWPEDWRTWSARSWMRREWGGLGNAGDDARKATDLNPQDAKSWNVLCQVLWGHGAHLEGIDAGQKAVAANPDEWLAWYYLGLHWHKMQEKDDGAWRATQGRDEGGIKGQTPSDSGTSRDNFLRTRNSRLGNAVHDFFEALRVEPEDFRTSYLLTDTLIQLERYDEAYDVATQALAYSPFCYMRWGGMAVAEVRLWADALQYRHLLKADPKNLHERIGKAMMLAIAGGASTSMIHDERQLAELLTSYDLLMQAAADPALARGEEVFFCYASDRLLDSLMKGGGRDFYFEAVSLCEKREKLGRFLDADFWLRYSTALAGASEYYRTNRYKPLVVNSEVKAEFDSLNMNLMERRQGEYLDRAAGALRKSAECGARVATLPGWDRLPINLLRERPDWAELEALIRETPLETLPVSIYDALMVIVNVVEGGPAENAGLRKFDQITQVNDIKVLSTQDFMGTWGPIPEGTETTLHVRRMTLKDGEPVAVKGTDGKPLLDENGFVTWESKDFTITIKRGYLGINLGEGMVPPRFKR